MNLEMYKGKDYSKFLTPIEERVMTNPNVESNYDCIGFEKVEKVPEIQKYKKNEKILSGTCR